MSTATLAKWAALMASLGIVSLWILLAVVGPTPGSPGRGSPVAGPAGPPILLGVAIFGALAVAGAVAAFRGAPLVTALCGGISLVPVGLYLLVLPWPFRLIGILDAVLVAAGVLLLRVERPPAA